MEISGSGKAIALILSILILTIGGCEMFSRHKEGLTIREKEKTKQVEMQTRIDSMKVINNNN